MESIETKAGKMMQTCSQRIEISVSTLGGFGDLFWIFALRDSAPDPCSRGRLLKIVANRLSRWLGQQFPEIKNVNLQT